MPIESLVDAHQYTRGGALSAGVSQAKAASWRVGATRVGLAWVMVVLGLAGAGSASLHAADVECGVGVRVAGEFGGGEIGTIAEVGSESPHVGAYRITFGWSPKGEWYHPRTWEVHPEGTQDRCVTGAPPRAPTNSASAYPSSGHSTSASNAPAAAAMPSTDSCREGTAVRDRQGRMGTVQGENNGMCVVRLEDGSKVSYLAWMLAPAGAAAAPAVGGLAAGSYVCSTEGAGQFPIRIVDASRYVDRAGAPGSYSLQGDLILFSSGSLAGYYSRLLADGKFGLSSSEVRTFYVVCNRSR